MLITNRYSYPVSLALGGEHGKEVLTQRRRMIQAGSTAEGLETRHALHRAKMYVKLGRRKADRWIDRCIDI